MQQTLSTWLRLTSSQDIIKPKRTIMTITKNFKRFGSVLAAGVLAMSVITAQALTVSPARAELTGDPGETISDSFLIINEQDTEQTYYTSVENFESQGETGTPNFTASKEGLPSWVTVDEKVTLKKGERIKVPYSIAIPQGADAGGHFAAIFLSTVPPTAEDGQVSVGAKVGMLILLKVTGDVKEEGGLISFELSEAKKVLTSLPVNFVYRFKNDGNDRVKPEGSITVKNTFGMEVATIDANTKMGNVLPGSVRRYVEDLRFGDKDAPAVSAPFFDHVKFQKDNFALGMYTATLALSFGNSGKAESSVTFFMFPWQLLTVTLVIILVIVLLFVVLVKHYNKWIIKQARAAAKK